MHRVTCPTFIVHGKQDTLIPISHARELKERCFGPCTLREPFRMTHNRYDAYEDIIRPLMSFFATEEILVQEPRTAPVQRLNEVTNFGEDAESAAQNHQFL